VLTVVGGCLGVYATLHPARAVPTPFVVNLTDSMPRGLYWRHPVPPLRYGTIVLFPLPDPVWQQYGALLRQWGWQRQQGPLLKPVGALPGDEVCVEGRTVTVNGTAVATQLVADSQGHPMPRLQGCLHMAPGTFLPLSTHSPRSFDGRYFGPVPSALIEATAQPLWTAAAGGGVP
jgi:conjugative transfer signal peptidase TraF